MNENNKQFDEFKYGLFSKIKRSSILIPEEKDSSVIEDWSDDDIFDLN
jgi:hypothetical protein